MAIVVPMRKKYKPRNIVESVVDNVLRLRSNCKSMTNPNTQAQQHVRSRFTLMQKIHTNLAPLFRRGFNRQRNARERWIGAYHVALGHNMREAAQYDHNTGAWRCNFSRFSLCIHQSRAPKRITMQREDNLLILSYQWKGKAERTSILWAVYNRKRNQWVQGIHDTHLNGKVTACTTPSEWKNEPLEVLIGFGRDAQGQGKQRGTHHFSFTQSVGIVTVRGGIRELQHTVTQGNIHSSAHAVTAWKITSQSTSSYIEIQNDKGVTLWVKIGFLT